MVRRPAVPHNSIAARLTRSRSGCLGVACSVVATWRLSQLRKSSSTIANSEPLTGSMWSSLVMWSSPDLSASRTTAAALALLALRRWRTSSMASPNDSNEGVGSTALGHQFVESGYFVVPLQAGPKVDVAIRSAAWHYCRASILNLYGCGSPSSCTFCGAVSRDDEQFEPG